MDEASSTLEETECLIDKIDFRRRGLNDGVSLKATRHKIKRMENKVEFRECYLTRRKCCHACYRLLTHILAPESMDERGQLQVAGNYRHLVRCLISVV